jgi:hypothetical protein
MVGVDEFKYGRQQVIEHFTSGAVHWGWFYRGTDASSRVFQCRHKVILRMISRLSPPKNACVLEVVAVPVWQWSS